MGRWTYFSPLWLGPLIVLLLSDSLRQQLPPWASGWHWVAVVGAAIVFGAACQLLLVGLQGAFAQVLPVPGGRSVRGRPAVVGGWLLIAWFALASIAALLLAERLLGACLAFAVASLAALGGAVVIYVWSLPGAAPDFRDEASSARRGG